MSSWTIQLLSDAPSLEVGFHTNSYAEIIYSDIRLSQISRFFDWKFNSYQQFTTWNIFKSGILCIYLDGYPAKSNIKFSFWKWHFFLLEGHSRNRISLETLCMIYPAGYLGKSIVFQTWHKSDINFRIDKVKPAIEQTVCLVQFYIVYIYYIVYIVRW